MLKILVITLAPLGFSVDFHKVRFSLRTGRTIPYFLIRTYLLA